MLLDDEKFAKMRLHHNLDKAVAVQPRQLQPPHLTPPIVCQNQLIVDPTRELLITVTLSTASIKKIVQYQIPYVFTRAYSDYDYAYTLLIANEQKYVFGK